MRTTAIAVFLLTLATSPGAITWEFEEDTQGWQIRLKSDSGSFFPPLDMVVEEGVLRIPITDQFLGSGRNPVLVSPQLNLDSGLFDRVEVRLRFVHPDPVATSVVLGWTNDRTPDVLDNWFLPVMGIRTVFTSEWQEVVFHPLGADEGWGGLGDDSEGIVAEEWEGIVQEIQLTIDLFEEL